MLSACFACMLSLIKVFPLIPDYIFKRKGAWEFAFWGGDFSGRYSLFEFSSGWSCTADAIFLHTVANSAWRKNLVCFFPLFCSKPESENSPSMEEEECQRMKFRCYIFFSFLCFLCFWLFLPVLLGFLHCCGWGKVSCGPFYQEPGIL